MSGWVRIESSRNVHFKVETRLLYDCAVHQAIIISCPTADALTPIGEGSERFKKFQDQKVNIIFKNRVTSQNIAQKTA